MHRPQRRTRALLIGLAAELALVLALTAGSERLPWGFGSVGSHDFVQYWSAGRLLLQGRNPYDADLMMPLQQSLGWDEALPLMMWNPPHTLALVVPFALLPFGTATVAWLLVQVLLVLASADVLRRYYGLRRAWVGFLLCAVFVPVLMSLAMGQISPWLLAGIALYLWAERRGRHGWAGVALALLLVKPHVVHLFLIAAGWQAVRGRRWAVPTGLAAALAASVAAVLAMRPQILADYLAATTQSPPMYWRTPTLGHWLRVLAGWDHYWLQFAPAVAGGGVLIGWLVWRRRQRWQWSAAAPHLLLLSVLTAAYGWSYDQAVLAPAVVAGAERARRLPLWPRCGLVVTFAALQAGLLAMRRAGLPDHFAYWHPIGMWLLYLLVLARSAPACAEEQSRPAVSAHSLRR